MCGRGACTLSADRCKRIAGKGARIRGASKLRPRYNLGPQGNVPVVLPCRDSGGGREVAVMRWGLVPSFGKRPEDYDVFKGGSSTFNARTEGLTSSGLWRRLVDDRRCVVLFDGFYEWKTAGKTKVPMFIRHPDEFDGHEIPASSRGSIPNLSDEKSLQLPLQSSQTSNFEDNEASGCSHAPLLLAALYDVWRPGGDKSVVVEDGDPGGILESTSILTMDPEGTPMTKVHDRMPVFLTPSTAARWLDTNEKFSDIIMDVLRTSKAHAANNLLLYEVPALVSNVRNESPDCIMPKKDFDARALSKGIGRFFQKRSGGGGGDSSIVLSPVNPELTKEGISPGKRKPEDLSLSDDPRSTKVICLDD